ncbi:type IV secretion system protein [Bifidobacterium miconisargentati]|uniref:type IV secretion system protein n=1 Tax=Bifidobacterium miconisargentati TaxID=2834437 RepID=UPI001BDC40FC|nr:type IV secretion system protein [Bifidobacterium miconisargentati]MBW3089220.1 type IV secretion system protein [Bifidobacterium miconisargentati]
MEDFVIDMLNAIGGGVDQTVVDTLLQAPSEYSASLYQLSLTVATVAVKPIAAIVLSIVFMLELARASQKADGDRELSVRLIGMIMIKLTLVLLAAQNADLMLKGIDEVGSSIMGGVTSVATTTGNADTLGLGDQMKDAVKDAGVFGQAACLVLLIIPFLVSKLAAIVFTVVVMLRFIQIYLMTAFNPLPIAFIACEETRQMGIGYFKSYASIVLQCVTLYLSVVMYRQMVSDVMKPDSFNKGDSLSGWVIGQFGNLLLASVLLIGVVAISNSVAKRWLGTEA